MTGQNFSYNISSLRVKRYIILLNRINPFSVVNSYNSYKQLLVGSVCFRISKQNEGMFLEHKKYIESWINNMDATITTTHMQKCWTLSRRIINYCLFQVRHHTCGNIIVSKGLKKLTPCVNMWQYNKNTSQAH